MDEGRSVLDQIRECAVVASSYPRVLTTFEAPIVEEVMRAHAEARQKLDTLDKAVAALREGTAQTITAIRQVPDDKLSETMKFFGEESWKVSTVMNAHFWNMTWHTAQICFIQTLLGDRKM
jgi:hypothetical protein